LGRDEKTTTPTVVRGEGPDGGDYEPEHPENLPPELASRIESATRVFPA
jgi:hypothetical protein